MLFASFHSKCSIPSYSDIPISSTVSFSIYSECAIPYTPGDLLSFTLLILLAAISGVTTNCTNLPPYDPLNFVSVPGNELVSSLVNAELKCIFNSSVVKNPTLPILSSSCPTLSRTLCLYCCIHIETHTA